MSISKKVRRLAVGATVTALTAGGLVAAVATPASADTVLHPVPEGCKLSTTGYVGSAQCAYSRYTFQVVVRCSDGSYRNGQWMTGPSPYYASASCYQNAPQPYATDVWINLPDRHPLTSEEPAVRFFGRHGQQAPKLPALIQALATYMPAWTRSQMFEVPWEPLTLWPVAWHSTVTWADCRPSRRPRRGVRGVADVQVAGRRSRPCRGRRRRSTGRWRRPRRCWSA